MALQDINKPLNKGEKSMIQTFLESDPGVKLFAQARVEGVRKLKMSTVASDNANVVRGWMDCLDFLSHAAEDAKPQLDDQHD